MGKVKGYVSAIESEGRTRFFRQEESPAVSAILRDLQIYEGFALDLSPPSRIFIEPSSERGSIVKAEDLQRAVEIEADMNKDKLGKSRCTERHLFVYVDQLSIGAWQAMINHCIPIQPPKLSSQITHVWAAAEVRDGVIVWGAEPPNAWQDVGLISGLKNIN